MSSQFKDKVAVITGSSSGIGRAIALSLAQEGATLILTGRKMKPLKSVAAQCATYGAIACCYKVDLSSIDELRHFAAQALKDWGGVDILVHSAGIIKTGSFAAATIANFDLQYFCNLRAPFALTQLFLPGLIKRKGQIAFINSTSGLSASAGIAQYAATKHALKGMADSLREEVNKFGVRVVSFYIGRTATPMQAQLHRTNHKTYFPEKLIQPEQVSASVLNALLLGPEAEITDVRIRPLISPE